MKTLVLLAAIFTGLLQSQVMNDAQVLLNGRAGFSMSVFRSNGKQYPAAGFGIGVVRNVDVDLSVKRSPGSTYVGMNTELSLSYKPNISLSLGGHYETIGSGADITLNYSVIVAKVMSFYTGFDADVNFVNGTTAVPVWYFAGINAFFFRRIEGFLEFDPALTPAASSMIIGGARFYF